MTLKDIIKNLQDIALTQPDVRAVSDGDVYEALNGNPSLKYSIFHVTQTNHSTDDGWDNYGLSLFLIDRLMDDSSNRLDIQSRAKETLKNIIYTFCQNFDAEHTSINFTPFTQKFKDNTAGVWCNVNISVMSDFNCPIDYNSGSYYPSVKVIDNLDIYINQVGVYEVPEGYTGYGTITVDFPIKDSINVELNQNNKDYVIEADPQYAGVKEVNVKVNIPLQTKDITVNENTTYTVEPDPQYDGLSTVNINVDVPLQTKEVTLKENTTYTIQPDPEYKGIEDLTINVDVPIPAIQEETTLTLYTGDKGTLLPNDGYDAFAKVNYEVKKSNADKMKIKEGICLSGSTFTSFDASNWDWSNVHDCSYMFQGCKNLTSVPTGLNVKPYTMSNMFTSCSNLTDISALADMDISEVTGLNGLFEYCSSLSNINALENWDVSKVTNMCAMFSQCASLTNTDAIKNWNTPKLTNLERTFAYCSSLTSVDISGWDLSNVTNMSYMFSYYNNLTEVRMGGPIRSDVNATNMFYNFSYNKTGTFYYPKEYDYTPIINALPSKWTVVAY